MDDRVIITEVGPRDGLQNLPIVLSAEVRVALIESLLAAGIRAIEVGSFVSPKAVPAMMGTDKLLAELQRLRQKKSNTFTNKKSYYSALVPNMKGYELAIESNVDAVAVVVAASDTMNRKNINQATDEAISGCKKIISASMQSNVDVIACIATAWECPFEGKINPNTVISMAIEFLENGAKAIVIADTIGAANPASVKTLTKSLVSECGTDVIGCHFHDTRGMALANAVAALDQGIRHFDSSIGGLGGCPFAPGAKGNLATEDLVLMLQQMGMTTDIDLNKLCESVELAQKITPYCQGGHSFQWLLQQKQTLQKQMSADCINIPNKINITNNQHQKSNRALNDEFTS